MIRRVMLAALVVAWSFTTARADLVDTPSASDLAAGAPGTQTAPTNPHASAGSTPRIGDVSVSAPAPPTNLPRAGEGLYQFVAHHATVHSVNEGTTGDLARWRGGKQSICPLTLGLSPGYNAFVTARLRAVAEYVGAPLDPNPRCENNVQLIFTNNPEGSMEKIRKWATVYFRNRYTGGVKDLIAYKGDYSIQGWYMTTRGGSIVLNTDVKLVGLDVLPVWPAITQNHNGADGGGGSGIGTVILIVDMAKVAGATVGTIADYLAMLTLSVAQSPDHCDVLPSILDLMSPSCNSREAPVALTAGDLAFLKALYYRNTGLGRSLSRAEIEGNMLRQFKTL